MITKGLLREFVAKGLLLRMTIITSVFLVLILTTVFWGQQTSIVKPQNDIIKWL